MDFRSNQPPRVDVPGSCPDFVGRTASAFRPKLHSRNESLSLESPDMGRGPRPGSRAPLLEKGVLSIEYFQINQKPQHLRKVLHQKSRSLRTVKIAACAHFLLKNVGRSTFFSILDDSSKKRFLRLRETRAKLIR